jgi:hypothetical protein
MIRIKSKIELNQCAKPPMQVNNGIVFCRWEEQQFTQQPDGILMQLNGKNLTSLEALTEGANGSYIFQ